MPSDASARSDSTLDDVVGSDRPARGLWARRVAVVVLVLVVAAASTGWLGVHSATATASRDGYTLTVTYPRVARAGLDVPLTIRVTAPSAWDDDVVIGVTATYFRLFETQGFFPEPSEVTGDGDMVWMTFSPPREGRVLSVDYDAYVQPSIQHGASAVISIVTESGHSLSLTIHTTIAP